MDHILWLTDKTIFSPLEVKQNSTSVRWYLKMQSVFTEHANIIAEKTVEYKELLKRRLDHFNRDLESYWEQVQDYENWGDIKHLARYRKKANVLDNRLVMAMEKIDRFNEEEASFGWELSQYPLRKQTHDKLTPYKKLFDAGQDFIDKKEMWLSSEIGSYDPEVIDTEIGTTYRTLLKLEKNFSDRPLTKQITENVPTVFSFPVLIIIEN